MASALRQLQAGFAILADALELVADRSDTLQRIIRAQQDRQKENAAPRESFDGPRERSLTQEVTSWLFVGRKPATPRARGERHRKRSACGLAHLTGLQRGVAYSRDVGSTGSIPSTRTEVKPTTEMENRTWRRRRRQRRRSRAARRS